VVNEFVNVLPAVWPKRRRIEGTFVVALAFVLVRRARIRRVIEGFGRSEAEVSYGSLGIRDAQENVNSRVVEPSKRPVLEGRECGSRRDVRERRLAVVIGIC